MCLLYCGRCLIFGWVTVFSLVSVCFFVASPELLDPSITADWKCARLYNDTVSGSLRIDWKGFCTGFTCFPCDPGANPEQWALQPSVCPDAFNGPRRVCVAPGYWVNANNLPWNTEVFLNNPQAVWLALIWSLLVVLGGFYLIFTCLDRRNRAIAAASRI